MRTVVVTGSASGLGAAICTRLQNEGSKVVGVDLVGADIEADLSTPEGREALASGLDGLPSLDGVVACAGVGPQTRPSELIASVNYFGAVATLRAAFPYLVESHRAAGLAIASNSQGMLPPDEAYVQACVDEDETAARARAAELDGITVYANSKLALARWVRRQVDDWGAVGVRLNALAPGPIETPLLQGTRDDPEMGRHVDSLPIPLRRTAQPDEIAAAATFLLSEEAAVIHGSVLFADGGTDALFRPDHA
jgi:NAD(P)-dependent dehydrogenase (short-subunit alcohol dehydrogenase family)